MQTLARHQSIGLKAAGSAGARLELSVNIPDLDTPLPLDSLLAIIRDWKATNQRRLELIELKLAKSISDEESVELARLQDLAGVKRQLLMPLPIKKLAAIDAALRQSGKWRGDR